MMNQPLNMTAAQANGLQNAAEALEQACTAVSGLADALYADCFEYSLAGLLDTCAVIGVGAPHEHLERAYQWMFTNYDRLSAEINAVGVLAELAVDVANDAVYRISQARREEEP